MTIKYNWCSTCEEICNDHATICTVCGDTLVMPPENDDNRNGGSLRRTRNETTTTTTGVRAIPEFLNDDVRFAGQEIRGMLADLSGQVREINDLARNSLLRGTTTTTTTAGDRDWQTIPAALLDPQPSQPVTAGRPTSKKTLEAIPKIKLNDQSSLFRQTTLTLYRPRDGFSLSFQPICGEFGPSTDIAFSKTTLIVASPRTGKGGLTEETKLKLINNNNNNNNNQKQLVYMERGDGITFVTKAIMAQNAGAGAVIIGNNTTQPWPYIMKDSKGEAKKLGLNIPVVMVKQEDGQKIVEECISCTEGIKELNMEVDFTIKNQPQDCVICCETFQLSQSVVQLPLCGHVFHDKCALIWLEKQNTCPYCRLELPTDDREYEEERRRQRRTHAGGSAASPNESEWSAYYG